MISKYHEFILEFACEIERLVRVEIESIAQCIKYFAIGIKQFDHRHSGNLTVLCGVRLEVGSSGEGG